MSSSREIRSKIGSIKNTQKITNAMEMVAASKMRKAQEAMQTSRPYADKIRQVVGHLVNGNSEYKHTYLSQRPLKRVGLIVVSTDRGLCGGLNNNLFKSVAAQLKKWKEQEVEVDLCVIGGKGESFFKRFGGNVLASATHLGDEPTVKQLIGVVKTMLDAYKEDSIQALHVSYSRFVNSMIQEPRVEQLLPFEPIDQDELSYHWDYIYEPNAKVLLDDLFTRYIESQVYQSMVESLASEHASRRVAMKSATDNAGTIIDELQLVYNKARQSAITQEINEIVSGAAAVE